MVGVLSVAPHAQQTEAPLTTSETLAPAELAKSLAHDMRKPTVVYVGFRPLYRPGHIPGAPLQGPASKRDGLEDLRRWAAPLARSTAVVIYCGCCPLDQCPNVRPALRALKEMGFADVRVLDLPTTFEKDWVAKAYTVERQ
jgi:thiosulfate/3-mercaptopyruvate sulfurtransferase